MPAGSSGRGRPPRSREGHPSTISFAHVPDVPADLAGISRIAHEYGRTTLETSALQRSMTDLMTWAAHNNVQLDALDARSPSLETVFLAIADGRDPADGADDALTLKEESLV